MRLAGSPGAFFASAYRGEGGPSGMDDFAKRMRKRAAIVADPRLWFWTPAFRLTLEWLARRAPAGTVLELGCGMGFMLHALRRAGFNAVGLDVAEPAVRVNEADGFRVWHGTVDTLPEGWVAPDAVVTFFVLHHLEDPAAFLADVRRRWPRAPLVIAQYGPSNYDELRSQPPRTLTRWNARALGTALERAGYVAEVQGLPGVMHDPLPLRLVRGILKTTLALPPIYRALKRIDRAVTPQLTRPLERADFVLLAFAEPTSAANAPR